MIDIFEYIYMSIYYIVMCKWRRRYENNKNKKSNFIHQMGGTEAFRSLRKWNTLFAGHVVNFLMCMNMRMKFIGRSFMSDQGKHLKRKKN